MGGVSRPTRNPAVEQGAREQRDPRNPWAPSAFARLARAHAAGIAGDALFAIGLAGTVFFSLDFNSARWRVALYLMLTIAPFAVAAPFIGPALDRIRGGRRWIIVGSMALRALLAFLVVRHLDSILFYPEAFGMLVLGKVYTISKSAVVPGTVRTDEELVEANSKLTVLSALVVVVAAAPGGLFLWLGGAQWTLALSGLCFAVGTVLALRLTPTTVAEEPAGEAEKEELRSAGIVLAGTAMAVIRGVVGFLSFMLAFAFKDSGGTLWQLGVVAATAQLGFFCGAVAAPRLRRYASEDRILVGALMVTAVGGLVTAVLGGLVGAALLSMLVGATGSASKQAFDAILQRDAPDANRGRSFARFETRFQLVWVLGALLPIIVPIPAQAGFLIVAVVTGTAAAWYLIGQRRVRQGRMPVRRTPTLRELVARRRGRGVSPEPTSGPTAPPPPRPPVAPSGRPPVAVPHAARPWETGPTDPTLSDLTVLDRTATFVPPPASEPARTTPDGVGDVTTRDPIPSPPPAGTGTGPGTSTAEPVTADPARRWMRPAPDTAVAADDDAGVAEPARPGQPGRAGERGQPGEPTRQGTLFGVDAWTDPTIDEAFPPD
jgi:hypothetical protein